MINTIFITRTIVYKSNLYLMISKSGYEISLPFLIRLFLILHENIKKNIVRNFSIISVYISILLIIFIHYHFIYRITITSRSNKSINNRLINWQIYRKIYNRFPLNKAFKIFYFLAIKSIKCKLYSPTLPPLLKEKKR